MTIFSCALAILLAACVTEGEPDGMSLGAGDRLPLFSVTDNNGQTISTDSLRGKTAIIIFFSTTCPDCREALPAFQEVYDAVASSPYVGMIAIARAENDSMIASYWEEHGLTLPYSPQDGREIYNLFAQSGIPRLFIASRNGIIEYSFGPENMPDSGTIINLIDDF